MNPIPANDLMSGNRDTVHLFSVDRDEVALWAFIDHDRSTDQFPLREALGVDHLDDKQIEGAVVEDLAGIGLSGFLVEGIGVDRSLIEQDIPKIDALTGSVVIVKGAAFDGAHIPLMPKSPLTHVGSWHLVAAPSTLEPLVAETAKGSVSQSAAIPAAPRNRYSLWMLIGIGLILLIGLLFGAFA